MLMIGEFSEACRHPGFCPAMWLSSASVAKFCKDGCCPDCGKFFLEEHPKTARSVKELVSWRIP